MIGFDFSPRDAEILELARAQAMVGRNYARQFDRAGALVPDALPEAADAPDVRALAASHADETSGAALIETLLFLEEVWGTIPFRKGSNQSSFLGSKLVRVLGSAEQARKWAHLSIAIAVTEPDAGSDPSRIRTTASWDDGAGEWVLRGEKIFISLAQSSGALLVLSRFIRGDEKGVGMFVVEKGVAGLTVGPQLDKLGQRGWDTANLIFDDCRLPASSHLAGAMRDTLAVFNGSRPFVAAIALGFSRAALDFTRAILAKAGHDLCYRRTAMQQAAPVARFIALEAVYDAALLTLMHAKWVEDSSGADKIEASMTKVNAAKAARRILDGCMGLLGAEAASERHLLEMWLRDARVCDIYEGAGEVNRLILARELLGYSAAELS